MRVKVYELARKLNITSKELLQELKELGVEVKSHLSALDEETAQLALETLSAAKPAPPPPEVEAPQKSLTVLESITVGELAGRLGISPAELIKKLISMNIFASINQHLAPQQITEIAEQYGVAAEVAAIAEAGVGEEEEDDETQLVSRPPVVTVMGHVNHGKTSLLDAIRQTDTVQHEKGGITQHIGAYEVEVKKGKVTFLDTPGHEAFTTMRARGAQVTDIVVLVVAADDGIMPQTMEAIDHARAANVPIVVAINKVDKANANPTRVKQQLTEHELLPEEYGGKTICMEVSAVQKQGLEELLEMLLLEAEMLELKANPYRRAKGTVIEAKLDKGRGAVATVLIEKGTLRVGEPFVSGLFSGKVRAMINDRGHKVEAADPSMPVEVLGFTGVPYAGERFEVVPSERAAREITAKRQQLRREQNIRRSRPINLEDIYAQIKEGSLKELNLVIKGDVQGSVEALAESLQSLSTEEVKLRVIHAGAGAITESDVMLASASKAIIIGFHIKTEPGLEFLAKEENVDIRFYNVIYDVIADVRAAMEGLLEPYWKEVMIGQAEVRQVFTVSRIGLIAGSYVQEGKVIRGAEARVKRNEEVICEGKISSLRRFKEDVREVQTGFECGIGITDCNDLQTGDFIEVFRLEQETRRL